MQDHDVLRADEVEEGRQVPPEHLLVLRAVGVGGGVVLGSSMDRVVEPLRQPEEERVAGEDQPAATDAGVDHIAEQRVQHLGHPATGRG